MNLHRLRHLPLLLTIAAFAGWFLTFAPTTVGGPATYIWVSGTSMEPTLMTGDLVILRRSETYAPGQVVAFRIPDGEPGAGTFVIHRIIGGSTAQGFVMQGDNKPRPDPWHPVVSQVLGAQWLTVSGGARYLNLLRTPTVFASIAAGLIVFVVMAAGGSGGKKAPARPSVLTTWARRLRPQAAEQD
jgi:signal peptidase I